MGVLSLIRACRPHMTSVSMIRCTLVPGLGKASNLMPPTVSTQFREIATTLVRTGGADRMFVITPSRYSWTKYKDAFHFYFMLGMIPGLAVVFLVNVFIGPPKLAPIPEGYIPKEHEYHKHPFTRWMMKYFFSSHQQVYERNLFYMAQQEQKRTMKMLTRRVEDLMAYRGDYPNYFVRPPTLGRYFRYNVQEFQSVFDNQGLDTGDVGIPPE